jgi:hypothetical protein
MSVMSACDLVLGRPRPTLYCGRYLQIKINYVRGRETRGEGRASNYQQVQLPFDSVSANAS